MLYYDGGECSSFWLSRCVDLQSGAFGVDWQSIPSYLDHSNSRSSIVQRLDTSIPTQLTRGILDSVLERFDVIWVVEFSADVQEGLISGKIRGRMQLILR
jgi:hypothetical protein